MWTLWESNPRPHACEACALPAELRAHQKAGVIQNQNETNQTNYADDTSCSRDGIRTHDLLDISQVLYQTELRVRLQRLDLNQ